MTEQPGVGVAWPSVGIPGAVNNVLGPKAVYWDATPDGKAVLSLDMEPVYMETIEKGAQPPPGAKTARYRRFGAFVDHGVRANRYVAVDLSGVSGAPVLFVLIDKFSGAKGVSWNLNLSKAIGAGKVEGNAVTVGDPKAENLKCTFIAPKAPELTGAIKAKGGNDFFVVLTVQNGVAPEIKVDGEGLSAKVMVGGQTIRLEGEKIILEK